MVHVTSFGQFQPFYGIHNRFYNLLDPQVGCGWLGWGMMMYFSCWPETMFWRQRKMNFKNNMITMIIMIIMITMMIMIIIKIRIKSDLFPEHDLPRPL